MRIEFPGYPTQISDEIAFPDVYELLQQPILDFAPAEWVMKHGTEFQKYLLNKAPLENNCNHVYFSCVVRYVYPGILVNKVEVPQTGATRNEWHVDIISHPRAKVHTIANTLGTEFNTNPFAIDDVPDGASYFWFCEEATKHEQEWGLTPKDSPANRFITFSNHAHRAALPTKKEIRFFCRINEMDSVFDPANGQYKRNFSYVFNGHNPIINVVQNHDGTVSLPLHCPLR